MSFYNSSCQFNTFHELMRLCSLSLEEISTPSKLRADHIVFSHGAKLANRVETGAVLRIDNTTTDYGSHLVDYSNSIEDMIAAANLSWVNNDITSENFSLSAAECFEWEHIIFMFEREISSIRAVIEIIFHDPKKPWQPAKIDNLLAYGTLGPNQQIMCPVVALGSSCISYGELCVPLLGNLGTGRALELYWWDYNWSSKYRFLARRKQCH